MGMKKAWQLNRLATLQSVGIVSEVLGDTRDLLNV